MIADKMKYLDSYAAMNARFPEAFAFLKELIAKQPAPGRYVPENCDVPGAFFVNVSGYDSKVMEAAVAESHKKYIDVQVILSGNEAIYVPAAGKEPSATMPFDNEKDYALYAPTPFADFHLLRMTAGSFAIFFPGELHAPSVALDGKSEPIRKAVLKVLM